MLGGLQFNLPLQGRSALQSHHTGLSFMLCGIERMYSKNEDCTGPLGNLQPVALSDCSQPFPYIHSEPLVSIHVSRA